MVDASCIGSVYAPYTVAVTPADLLRFAAAIGETRPEYVDEAAARAAGHPGLLVPPTFAVCLEMDRPEPFEWLRELDIDIARVIHGAQSFRYFAPAHAGDHLTFAARIADVAVRRRGALTVMIRETDVTNQLGENVMQFRSTVIVRA
jgi:acyl dehydratase